jgi:hypothetical protein
MSDQTVINKDVGYFSTETGAQELLSKLFKEKEPNPPSQHVPHEFLGDSLRENRIEAKADPVEFKGIRIKGWVIGSNKSHITPLDLLDKYVLLYICIMLGINKQLHW